MRVLVACLSFLLLAVPAALAQTGTPPFGSFSGSSFDTVNNANLNVHLQIPIVSKAGRGLPFSYAITYDNSVWSRGYANGNPSWIPSASWGWAGSMQPATGSLNYNEALESCYWPENQYGTTYYFNEFYINGYTDPSGTGHPLNVQVSGYSGTPCQGYSFPPSSASGTATDGSGFTVQANAGSGQDGMLYASVTGVSGVTVVPPLPNFTSTVTDSNGNQVTISTSGSTTTFTDTLGTTALTVSGSNPLTYSYTNPSGGTSQVTVNYSVYTVQTNFACSGVSEFGPTSESLIHTVTLADGTSYTFNYEPTPGHSGNVTGRIASVTLPTGGAISYAYPGANDSINCGNGSTNELNRTTPDGEWKYSVTGSAPSVTTVTDPQSNKTVYDFEGIYQTQEQINQGSSTLLETLTTCYNGNTTNCPSTAVSLPITSVATTTAWASGQQSKTATSYNGYGLPTEVDEYGYGNSAVGPLVRKTITGYATLSNPSIHDRPSSVVVRDGGNNLKSQMSYSYDGNGNLLTLTENVTPSSTLSRSFTYGQYGVLQTATDFAGNTTTFTNGDCSGAFPTSIAQPLSLTSLMAWNCGAGLVTSVTDPNSQTTSFSYDELDRVTQTNYPDGGQTSTTYNDGASSSVATTTALGAPGNRVDTALLDGLGRVTETQLASDPAGADKVDTAYDSLGRVGSVSNPYRSTSDPTYGKTQYSYDALGRVTQVTEQDGNTVQEAYGSGTQQCPAATYGLGYPVVSTNEYGWTRSAWTDALGRLIEVDESDGYATCYSYDALGNLTQAVQGSQTRTYSYDMLSRLTSATTPESGTTTYNYSGCSGDPSNVCSRTDARGITTTYAYDALNRLTSKSYSDGTTPSAHFYYDEGTVYGPQSVWIAGLGNTKGRLSHTSIEYSNGTSAYTLYGYDPVGRVEIYWQCTPYNCNSPNIWGQSYTYDLAGDMASRTYPAGFTITNTINKAQQITQITSSLFDATHPQNLAKSITYTPWGAEQTLENGCTSSSGQETGCADTLETYAYNKRLQPVMIELGTQANPTADYCLSYNYYAVVWNPTSCALPGQSGGNHGLVLGYYYQDNVNPSLSHLAYFGYNGDYRLIVAQASGNSNYNFTYNYDRWGNMTCTINGQTNGPCPEYSFNSANNQITNTGYTYDAAGDLTSDGTNTYQYDAEGRPISVNSGSTMSWSYNAMGDRTVYSGPSATTDILYTPGGQRMGYWNQSLGDWGFQRFRLGGRMMAYYNPDVDTVRFEHVNGLDSATMVTDQTGALVTDQLFYPWGDFWQGADTEDPTWASLLGDDRSEGFYPAQYREYGANLGRWLTPDLLGGDITNPQSLNRYAYALNNPTTLTDPLGLDSCWDYSSYEGSGGPPPCSGPAVAGPVSYTLDGVDVPGSIVGGALSGGFALPSSLAGTGAQLISSSGGNFQYSYPLQIGTETLSLNGSPIGQQPIYGPGVMNINLFAAPVGPDGQPLPPPVSLPPGANGQPNSWRPVPGSPGRPVKWVPASPVPGAKGGQPSASWDDQYGHWDYDNGKGDRTRLDPAGNPANHPMSIVPTAAKAAAAAGATSIILQILEGLGEAALAF